METRWVGLVLIALLAGLAGGFASSYIVYQPQIASLKSDLNEALQSLDDVHNELNGVKSKLSNIDTIIANLTETLANLTRAPQSPPPPPPFEKLEFMTVCVIRNAEGNYRITMDLENTGSESATIDIIFFNGVPDTELTGIVDVSAFKGKTINPNSTLSGSITLVSGTNNPNSPFMSGMSLELMIQTVDGKQYPKVVVLP